MALARRRLPSPGDLGLPEKFDSWRPGQEEFLDVIITSDKRHKVGNAPTGFGKSAAVVGGALYSQRPTCIVTATKGLQDQYMDDFASIGMVSIKGRANYPCSLRPEYSCEEGSAARCPSHGSVMCPSSQDEMAAAASSLVVTNYAKWTASRKFGTGMAHFTQVVFDEGDEGPEAIASAMQVVLSAKEVNEGLKIDFPSPHEAEEMALWKQWAKNASVVAEVAMQTAKARITGVTTPKPSHVRHYTHMRNLWRRLAIIRTARPDDWIVDIFGEGLGYVFDPIRIGRYAESTLMLAVPSIIWVSATIIQKTMYMMGVAAKDFEYREFPSDFDPRLSPIYYIPTMRVDSKADSLSPLWLRHDQIATKRQDRNGLVHTVSYPRQRELIRESRFGHRMIFNEQGRPVSVKIDEFFNTYPGAIFASPSVESGYDFKFKRAEWQLLCKIPFDPPSKILKAREADDREYRNYNAVRRVVQSIGRIVRDKVDQGETFMGDEHLEWFLPKAAHLFPKRFNLSSRTKSLIQRVTVIPPPPPRLI